MDGVVLAKKENEVKDYVDDFGKDERLDLDCNEPECKLEQQSIPKEVWLNRNMGKMLTGLVMFLSLFFLVLAPLESVVSCVDIGSELGKVAIVKLKKGQSPISVDLFNEMKSKRIGPDAYTYNTLMSGMMNKVNLLLRKMNDDLLHGRAEPVTKNFTIVDDVEEGEIFGGDVDESDFRMKFPGNVLGRQNCMSEMNFWNCKVLDRECSGDNKEGVKN